MDVSPLHFTSYIHEFDIIHVFECHTEAVVKTEATEHNFGVFLCLPEPVSFSIFSNIPGYTRKK